MAKVTSERIEQAARDKLSQLQAAYTTWLDQAMKIGHRDYNYAILAEQFIADLRANPSGIAEVNGQDTHDLIAINKPAGLAFGPSLLSANSPCPSLNELAMIATNNPHLANINRIDRFTSGVILFSSDATVRAHVHKSLALREGVHKTYVALVHGKMLEKETEIAAKLLVTKGNTTVDEKNGVDSSTTIELLEIYKDQNGEWYSLVRVYPQTGRTHQIRAHLSSIGFPIVGDYKYGQRSDQPERYYLHAEQYQLPTPGSPRRGAFLSFSTPVAEDMQVFIDSLTLIE